MNALLDRLDELYSTDEYCDIKDHLPLLRLFASQCNEIVELGVRYGISTVALLAGMPITGRLRSFDIVECPVQSLMSRYPQFTFVVGDSLKIPPQSSDLLFIDTLHTYNQLRGELALHGDHTRKYIILHDTELFGEHGELGQPGINNAWQEWLEIRPEWRVLCTSKSSCGLVVLIRR